MSVACNDTLVMKFAYRNALLKTTLGAATKEAFESQSDVVQISVK